MKTTTYNVHHGRNIRRLREILNVKQDTIAAELKISQQMMSKLEQKNVIDEEMLEKVSKALNIPVDTVKNFNEESAVNIIANNTFNDSPSSVGYHNYTLNPIEKITELYERLLKAEQDKVIWIEKMLKNEKGQKYIS
jgi:transcriptional regulator with XRE-family HTH domain